MVHHSQGYYRIGTSKHEYTIADHLGNTRVVYTDTNSNGTIELSEILDENHYYAYGMEMSDPAFLNNSIYKYKFNGIERTESLGLSIDLALYRGLDPVLGKWYQVDPKAEQAGFNMSPYCAMGNNPVGNVDPDGDLHILAAIGLGAVSGILSNGLSNLTNGQNFFVGAGKAAIRGAVSAAFSFGVGFAFGATGSFGHELLRAGAHGLSQGGISVAEGGNFWQGALSGSIGSGISSGIDALGGSAGHQILGGGLGGGIGSAISGSNFWQGFGQGIAVGTFNHALHSGFSKLDNGCPCEYNGKSYKTESDLYIAILADQAMQQFGITDLVALGGLLAGQPDISKRFVPERASKGTSILSENLRKANLGNFKNAKWAPTSKNLFSKTISKGAFVARWIPWVSAGILVYDTGMILYNTQVTHNKIVNGN